MNRRIGISVLMTSLVFVLFAACGGDDESSLDVYFTDIQVMDDEFKDRTNAIEFGGGDGSDEDALRAGRASIESITDVLRDFVDDLDTLTPPSLAAVEHEASVKAGRELIQRYVDLSGRLREASTPAELGDLLIEDMELGPAVERFQATCRLLNEVAADNGISVDFNCGDEEA